MREIFFSTVSTKIDDKKPKEKPEIKGSIEQIRTYSVWDSVRLEMILNSLATAGYI